MSKYPPTCGTCGLAMTYVDAYRLEFVCKNCMGIKDTSPKPDSPSAVKWPDQECGYGVPGGHCDKPAEWDVLVARIAELEGALDDAMAEIRDLRAWRERAWDAMREMGHEAGELMVKLGFPKREGRGG